MTEDEMVGWHHGLDGRESELAPGDGDGQGGLVCCNSWGRRESDTTEQRTELKDLFHQFPWSTEHFTLHPELLQGMSEVNSYSSTGFNLCRGMMKSLLEETRDLFLPSLLLYLSI